MKGIIWYNDCDVGVLEDLKGISVCSRAAAPTKPRTGCPALDLGILHLHSPGLVV